MNTENNKSTASAVDGQMSLKKCFAVLGVTAAIIFGGSFFFLRQFAANVVTEAESFDVDSTLRNARGLLSEEKYDEVIELLGPKLDVLNDCGHAEGLRLFADARALRPLENNRHLSVAVSVYRQVVAMDPSDSETLTRLFRIYEQIDDHSEAVVFGQQACRLMPEDLSLRVKVGHAMVKAGKVELALSTADELLAKSASDRAACALKIDALVAMGTAQPEVVAFISEQCRVAALPEFEQESMRNHLLLAYATAINDEDGRRMLLNSVANHVNLNLPDDQRRWLINELERSGRSTQAAEILAENTDRATPQEELELAYRYLQLGRHAEINDLLQNKLAAGETLQDEQIAIHFLSDYFSGNRGHLEEHTTRLGGRETQFAKTWAPLFRRLADATSTSEEVIAACEQVTDVYPQSAYVYLIYGQALLSRGESDVAVTAFRNAIQFAPKWAIPRVELSRLLLEKKDYASAIMEASIAIRSNATIGVAYELLLETAIAAHNNGEKFSPSVRDAVTKTIDLLSASAEKQDDMELLTITRLKLDGQQNQAEERIAAYLDRHSQPTVPAARRLAMLSSSADIRSRLQKLVAAESEETIGDLIILALDAGASGGELAAEQFIRSYTQNGEPLPAESIDYVTAETLTQMKSERAVAAWETAVNRHSTNAQILRMAIASPALTSEYQLRRQAIKLLQQISSKHEVTWRIEESRLLLDTDPTDEASAKVLLSMDSVLKVAPTSLQAYVLSTVAYERLGQPQRSVAVLEDAIQKGVDSLAIRLRLAELLADHGDSRKAIEYATVLLQRQPVNNQDRDRLIAVLIRLDQFEAAYRQMSANLKSDLEDTDDDFTFFAAFAIAAARSGHADEALKRIEPLAQSSERWFKLWIQASMNSDASEHQIAQWLKLASSWLGNDSFDQHRSLAAAYRQRARTSGSLEMLKQAIAIQRQIPDSVATAADNMILAGSCEKVGDTDMAASAYRKVIDGESESDVRSIALNNLALLESKAAHWETAEQLAQQAITLQARPEFVDTQVEILIMQNRQAEALDILSRNLKRWPGHASLMARYSALKKSEDERIRKSEAAAG